MNEKPEKPVLNYQRPMPGKLVDNWPLALGTILTFGIVGVAMLTMAFLTTHGLYISGLMARAGAIFVMAAIVIWQIERNW